MLKKLTFIVLLGASWIVFAAAADASDIKAAEKAWAEAVTSNDFAALEQILAEDLFYSHSNFAEDSKRSFIDNLKSGKARYFAIEVESTKVRMIDPQTALAISVARYETQTEGEDRQETTLKTLHVFRKNDGRWQLTAHQSARGPE